MSKCYRCPTCKTKCQKVVENKMRTSSFCVLVEANKFTRKAARSDLDEKIRAWGNAAPPAHFSSSRYAINLVTLEKVKFLKKGSFNLTKDQERFPLEICEEVNDAASNSDEETIAGTISDNSS